MVWTRGRGCSFTDRCAHVAGVDLLGQAYQHLPAQFHFHVSSQPASAAFAVRPQAVKVCVTLAMLQVAVYW